MKIYEFDYTKKDGEKTHREVMILNEKENYIDALDFGHLSKLEASRVAEIQEKYTQDMKPFVEKAFRRFSKDGITDLKEEKNAE